MGFFKVTLPVYIVVTILDTILRLINLELIVKSLFLLSGLDKLRYDFIWIHGTLSLLNSKDNYEKYLIVRYLKQFSKYIHNVKDLRTSDPEYVINNLDPEMVQTIIESIAYIQSHVELTIIF